jgi:hypothetical protein
MIGTAAPPCNDREVQEACFVIVRAFYWGSGAEWDAVMKRAIVAAVGYMASADDPAADGSG